MSELSISGASSLFLGIFMASLIGSGHCGAMCGLLGSIGNGTKEKFWSYHLGRLSAYLAIGLIFSKIGAGLKGVLGFENFAFPLSVLVGVVFCLIGIAQIFSKQKARLGLHLLVPQKLRALSARTFRNFNNTFLMGFAASTLPCGWLYSLMAISLGLGNTVLSAVAILAFWAGSLPVFSLIRLGSFGSLKKLLPERTTKVLKGGLYVFSALFLFIGRAPGFPLMGYFHSNLSSQILYLVAGPETLKANNSSTCGTP